MSIKLESNEIDKVNVYLGMINQYNSEMNNLNYTVQKTNQSLKVYIDEIVSSRNGKKLDGDYILNVDSYTLEPRSNEEDSTLPIEVVEEDGSSTESRSVN